MASSYYNAWFITQCHTILNAVPFPPPDEISIALVDFGPKGITFSWSPVAPDCPTTIHYNILASNCGSCPTTTNHTNVTCTGIPSNDSLCNFSIQTVVCGNITGNWSKPLTFNIIADTVSLNDMSGSKKGVYTIYISCIHYQYNNITLRTTVDTISISILTIGMSSLLVTIVIVILACYWQHKRNAILKTSSR